MPPVKGDSITADIPGVSGTNTAQGGIGVAGTCQAGDGVRAISTSGNGLSAFSDSNVGVFAQSKSKAGVFATSDTDVGVVGISKSNDGVRAISTSGNGLSAFSDSNVGVFAQSKSKAGVFATSDTDVGVVGISKSNDGVRAISTSGNGLSAFSGEATGIEGTGPNRGVFAHATGPSGVGLEAGGIQAGVKGEALSDAARPGLGHVGVWGRAISANIGNPATAAALQAESGALQAGARGVLGIGANVGVQGIADTGHGIDGFSATGVGVAGGAPKGAFAGLFAGDVDVRGNLTKSGGGFKIDHPLAPSSMYLSHSFVEAPERKNVYDGIAVLDDTGQARVALPSWFQVLNSNFRYQLTCIGRSAPVYIARKLSNNYFVIGGGYSGLEVSWQITGVRVDDWAKANPLSVEETKPTQESGCYRHPELCGEKAA